MSRCTDPNIGVNVLSYDLLEGEEKQRLESHIEECTACRDLVQQTFGDEGALQDIDLRAWRSGRRRPVAPHEWILGRVIRLWIPTLVVVAGVGGLILWIARRGPDPERVEIVRLATSRGAEIDSLAASPVPQIAPTPTTLILSTDRDAIVLIYESGADYLRRLVPSGDLEVPVVSGAEVHELTIPQPDEATARLLLVLAPASSPRVAEAWDRAVWLTLGGEAREGEERGWPNGVAATLRWVH